MNKVYFGPWTKPLKGTLMGDGYTLIISHIRPILGEQYITYKPTGDRYRIGNGGEILFHKEQQQYCMFVGGGRNEDLKYGSLEELMLYSDKGFDNGGYGEDYLPNEVIFLSQEDFDKLNILT
jgi:hypothetical protein